MTSTIRKRIWGGGFLIAGLLCSVAAAQTNGLASSTDKQQVWDLSTKLALAVKAGGPAVIEAWPSGNIALPRAATGTLSVVKGGTFGLSQRLRTRDSEIRLTNAGQVSLVTLDFEGSCITPQDVTMRYPDAKIIQHPGGHSLDERTYYATNIDNVRISFGFAERNPNCLDGVVVDPDVLLKQ